MSRLAVFRCDASPTLGSGHAMRCLTLAQVLEGRGWTCRFATPVGSRDAVPALGDRVAAVLAPAELAAQWPQGCDLLVVDNYALAADWEVACRPWARCILAIDDLADRPHDADLLLDHNLGRAPAEYAGLVPDGCKLMLGTRFGLLRPQFAAARAAALARHRAAAGVGRVLVSMGGTDAGGVTAVALAALRGLGLEVDVVMGAGAPSIAARDVAVHVGVDDMAGMMARADLAIGAGGVSSWERCCLGLPTILVVTAENQRGIARAVSEAGAAWLLGEAPGVAAADIRAAVQALMADPARLTGMSLAAAEICDGRGAERVADACEAS